MTLLQTIALSNGWVLFVAIGAISTVALAAAIGLMLLAFYRWGTHEPSDDRMFQHNTREVAMYLHRNDDLTEMVWLARPGAEERNDAK